jgi:hypothetical protein
MVDRIGAATRTLSIPDRHIAPGPVMRGPLDPASRYPVGPLPPAAPVAAGAILDGADTPTPNGAALQAMAETLLDGADAVLSSAMRPNQLFSRQLTWHPPDAAMMAASWQVMVRTYGQQRDAWLEQAKGQHVPSSLFMADHNPSAVREGRPGLPLVTEMEPWRFAVFAWGAERLVLKVVVRDDEESDARARKRTRVALRLELMLPSVGRVIIQLEPASSNGVLMEVGAAHTSAMQYMREALPQLAALVNRFGLTVVRCHLRRVIPAGGAEQIPTAAHTALLTAPLFKAMAEMAVLLSQPVPT